MSLNTELAIDSSEQGIPGLVTTGREHFADESSSASEHEVEQVLVDEDEDSESSSSSGSDTDSDLLETSSPIPTLPEQTLADDDEDDMSQKVNTAVGSKNEILDPIVSLPDIIEVDPSEHIEQVGQVLSIIDSVVIIRGLASQAPTIAVERVLDADSLLVFEDRKVLGHVFETFGPTTLPMYSVRFPTIDNIDHTQVQIGRPVYHLPHKSFYVFPRALAMLKGSDASNVHDEEPAVDELEYSDDEAERAAKQRLKNRLPGVPRRHQGHLERDGDLISDTTLPYDVADPYAMDSRTRPSPSGDLVPLDPYDVQPGGPSNETLIRQRQHRFQDRGDREFSRDSQETRGRERLNRRGGRQAHEGRNTFRGRGRSGPSWRPSDPPPAMSASTSDLRTGESFPWIPPGDHMPNHWPNPGTSFSMNGTMQGYSQQQFVVPHINPRFANAFAYNGGFGMPPPGLGPGVGVQGQFPLPTDYSWHHQQQYSNTYNGDLGPER